MNNGLLGLCCTLVMLIALSGAGYAASSAAPSKQKHFVLAADVLSSTKLFQKAQRAYDEIFRRIGCTVKLRYIPSARGHVETDGGFVDGDYYRIREYGKIAPNMVRVDVPLVPMEFGIYAMSARYFSLHTRKDILEWSGQPLLVGLTRGVLGTEMAFRNVKKKTGFKLHEVKDISTGIQMLLDNRIDVFVGSNVAFEQVIKEYKSMGDFIRRVGTLSRHTGYLYMHKKHKALVPRLEAAIRSVKKDGSFQRIMGFPAAK